LRTKNYVVEKLTKETKKRSYLATIAVALRLVVRIATIATTTTTTLFIAITTTISFFFILSRVDFLVTFTTTADFPFKPSRAFILD
jgi:hypothetical protein